MTPRRPWTTVSTGSGGSVRLERVVRRDADQRQAGRVGQRLRVRDGDPDPVNEPGPRPTASGRGRASRSPRLGSRSSMRAEAGLERVLPAGRGHAHAGRRRRAPPRSRPARRRAPGSSPGAASTRTRRGPSPAPSIATSMRRPRQPAGGPLRPLHQRDPVGREGVVERQVGQLGRGVLDPVEVEVLDRRRPDSRVVALAEDEGRAAHRARPSRAARATTARTKVVLPAPSGPRSADDVAGAAACAANSARKSLERGAGRRGRHPLCSE